jgi:predicted Zn-dependent protease
MRRLDAAGSGAGPAVLAADQRAAADRARPEINRYINVLGDSIARVADRRDLDWSFYVVDSKEVNAFAVPGGFIYINRGLIERASKMDEVAGRARHEIGHVTERHSVEQMQKQQQANIGVTLACVLTRVCESQAAARRSTSPAARSSPASAGTTRRRPTRWACSS